jgi:ubiquinol-cytochrome c reductase iron-sulfur subunit
LDTPNELPFYSNKHLIPPFKSSGVSKINMSNDNPEKDRRKLLIGSLVATGTVGTGVVSSMFIQSMQPTDAAQEKYKHTIKISEIKPGEYARFELLASPVIVFRRTAAQIEHLKMPNPDLTDPISTAQQQPAYAKNELRSVNPEYLVALPVCTHLGCAVDFFSGEKAESRGLAKEGGFQCPCHGARFDLAGRVFKNGPALTNLKIPAHRYLKNDEIELIVGTNKDI